MLLSEIESINYVNKKNSLFYEILEAFMEYKNYTNVSLEGKIQNFEIRSLKFHSALYIMMYDLTTKKYVVGAVLTPFGRAKRAWQVESIGVKGNYQGMNLSVKLYEWIVKQKNLILITGMSQSIGGRSIWERLVNISGIFIFGYDIDREQSFQIDQKDLFDEDIYSDELIKERDELKNEYTKIENQLDNLNPDTTRETEFKKLEKRQDILNNQIAKLDMAIDKANDYIRLVAIKKH